MVKLRIEPFIGKPFFVEIDEDVATLDLTKWTLKYLSDVKRFSVVSTEAAEVPLNVETEGEEIPTHIPAYKEEEPGKGKGSGWLYFDNVVDCRLASLALQKNDVHGVVVGDGREIYTTEFFRASELCRMHGYAFTSDTVYWRGLDNRKNRIEGTLSFRSVSAKNTAIRMFEANEELSFAFVQTDVDTNLLCRDVQAYHMWLLSIGIQSEIVEFGENGSGDSDFWRNR